jgi:hypothetical protein
MSSPERKRKRRSIAATWNLYRTTSPQRDCGRYVPGPRTSDFFSSKYDTNSNAFNEHFGERTFFERFYGRKQFDDYFKVGKIYWLNLKKHNVHTHLNPPEMLYRIDEIKENDRFGDQDFVVTKLNFQYPTEEEGTETINSYDIKAAKEYLWDGKSSKKMTGGKSRRKSKRYLKKNTRRHYSRNGLRKR